jgi:uncharacterized protein (DUF2267 family)
MDYEQFVTLVEQDLGTGRERTEQAIRAPLQTLAERIASGEARDHAAERPDELAPWIATTTGAERFDIDEFLRRVAEREGVDVPSAERHARAVSAVLGQAVSRQELDDLAAQLPKDYGPLLPTGPRVDTLAPRTFLKLLADRAGVRDEDAEPVTEAVLETLAERIAGGEVNDLISRLPVRCMSRCGMAASAAAARQRGCRWTSSSRGWPSAPATRRIRRATTYVR